MIKRIRRLLKIPELFQQPVGIASDWRAAMASAGR